MALVYRIVKQVNTDRVFLNGQINEDAGGPLNDLLEKIGPNCTINLKEINNINSLGVRTWVQFMRKFELTRSVILEECTPEVIDQINIIPNFKGKSIIQSLYGRYLCEKCGREKLQLFKLGENMPKRPKVEKFAEQKCPQCGSKMELEELEDEFFACILRE